MTRYICLFPGSYIIESAIYEPKGECSVYGGMMNKKKKKKLNSNW